MEKIRKGHESNSDLLPAKGLHNSSGAPMLELSRIQGQEIRLGQEEEGLGPPEQGAEKEGPRHERLYRLVE